jgi:cyclopropane fatty-acyl-phospholipid synthase-like methyltransferase
MGPDTDVAAVSDADLASIGDHYAGLLRMHGPTPEGVGWRNMERQQERFRRLTSCIDRRADFTVLDIGCGYGALFDHIAQDGRNFAYWGTDIAPEMVEQARRVHAGAAGCSFSQSPPSGASFDYVFASGIFNVMRAPSQAAWETYVFQTMGDMFSRAGKAMACNFLTIYSDPARKENGLFYADPCRVLDFCVRDISRNIALTHHYGTWDFTVQAFRE